MTKRKNSKKSGKKKAKPRAQRNEGRSVVPSARKVSSVSIPRGVRAGHHTTVCSITDPFCIHARGAQRPDGGPPSIPFQVRGVYTVLASATNAAARVVFLANPLFQLLAPESYNSAGSGVWDMLQQYTQLPGNKFLIDNAKEIRMTSFGCIVRSAMTATTAKGLVVLSSDPAPFPDMKTAIGTMDAPESVVVTLAAGMEHTWVSKPLGPTAHHFKPVSAFTNTSTDFDWTSLAIEVVGGDNTNSVPYLTVEYVYNVELTLSTGLAAGNAQLARAPPAPNRHALAAAEKVHATRPSFIEGGITSATKYLEKMASDALTSVASEGLALLGL